KLSNPAHLMLLGSPNVADHLAPEAGLVGLLTGHHAPGRGKDDDAQAAEHARDLGLAGVDAEAGLADPSHPDQGAAAPAFGLEYDVQLLLLVVALDVVGGDVALVPENAGDLHAEAGGRQRHPGMS